MDVVCLAVYVLTVRPLLAAAAVWAGWLGWRAGWLSIVTITLHYTLRFALYHTLRCLSALSALPFLMRAFCEVCLSVCRGAFFSVVIWTGDRSSLRAWSVMRRERDLVSPSQQGLCFAEAMSVSVCEAHML